MPIVRIAIWACAFLPAFALVVLWIFLPMQMEKASEFANSANGALVSSVISYYSLLFALFAAVEVKNLSYRYFFKIRSPEIHKTLTSLTDQISTFQTEPSEDLQSQNFVHETIVALRAAKRMKNSEVARIAGEAETLFKGMLRQAELKAKPGVSAGQLPDYWLSFQKVAELSAELKSQLDDARSMQ